MGLRLRLLGFLLVLGGVCVGFEAYRAFANTASMAEMLAGGTQGTPHPIAAVHWAQAGRGASLSFLLMAVGVSLTGFALLGRCRWAWGVLAATLVVDTVWLINQRLALAPD